MSAPLHPEEERRLIEVDFYKNDLADSALDDLVTYASEVCEAPVALITALGDERQWFLAKVGTERTSTSRRESFCAYTILQDDLLEVPDATLDPRFAGNPVVVGEPFIRFYAGVPVKTSNGLPIGSICVLDVKPRLLSPFQRRTLILLARQVESRLELRRRAYAITAERARSDKSFETAQIGLWSWDALSNRAQATDLVKEFFGISLGDEDLTLDRFVQSMHPDDQARVSQTIHQCIKRNELYEIEYRVVGFERRERWVLARGNVDLTEDGQILGLTGILLDITARKRMETERQVLADQLSLQTALWDSALSNITDIVFVFDREVRFRYANRALLELWGIPLEAALNKSCEDLDYPPEVAATVRRDVNSVFENGRALSNEVAYTSPTGASGLFDYNMAAIFGPDGSVEAVAGSTRDVTERNAAVDALRRSEERFLAAQETNPNAFTILEAVRDDNGAVQDFRWTYVNPATFRLTGETAEDLVGNLATEKRPGLRESRLFQAWMNTVDNDAPFNLEVEMLFPSGKAFLNLTGVKFGDGVATSFLDLTARQRNEEQLQEAVSLRTAELQNTVKEAEAFNYSISHDLRAPLRAMAATASILLEEASEALQPEHRELLVRQNENAKRLGRLIDELLRFSRLARAEVKRQRIDMTAEAHEVAAIARLRCPIEVQEGMSAMADPELIRTVMQNLIDNACKFSPDGGTIQVGESDGVFFVRDQGVGFDMRFAQKVFFLFERLVADADFPGTGIGLANVDRIIRRHEGKIWAESAPGQGSTFFFTLEPNRLIPRA